uniref:Reverse transcriptase domain-containing protein n=1 Tax=Tanacetum cinerariifolium TaxID=118510 RepID=A0A6L2LS67_TANCI|nr:reverse transcriptase domain-containing protein [Tanacetum cinerariifolium]
MVRPNGQALRSMEELCQPSINGQGGPIAPIPIQATDFGLRHHMIQQVQNTCHIHGLPGDDANRYIDKFLEITQHIKQNGAVGSGENGEKHMKSGCRGWREILCTAQCFERGLGTGVVELAP